MLTNYDPYDHIVNLEQRIAGLEKILQKVVQQISGHSHHLEQFSEQGQHVAQALQGLHKQTQHLNTRVSILETIEDIK